MKFKKWMILPASYAVLETIAILKKGDSVYDNKPEEKNPLQGQMVKFIEDENEPENADGVKGLLVSVGKSNPDKSTYNKYFKQVLDKALSFAGLVVLAPVYAGISLAIVIDDPGPVIFTQKRVGKDKEYFKLHKFRSMKMSTPHDVPTHMLDNPDQYITRVGKFIRAHSLDELPQIWDIFMGNMSVIGPRPGLWNQDLLTAERDKYYANDIKPGLTGLAQINGRDELGIPEKAILDGEYYNNLGFVLDLKCFLGSLHVFRNDESVVEGGTGELHKALRQGVPEIDPPTVFGCDKKISVDNSEKKVLITGSGSYIGESFKKYALLHFPMLNVETVDTLTDNWRNINFGDYDCVYHVAGIAHADVDHIDDATKEKYYQVNTDLAIEIAKKAKSEGVKQFVFMSSIIIYGDSAPFGKNKIITKDTVPAPANFYGDSKWQADKAIRALDGNGFSVAVLRPPMIYGKNSKGNYQTLSKIAKSVPVFPYVNNSRSMLHIDNLCEFLGNLIMSGENGVYFPQNNEYTNTSKMVKKIGDTVNHKIILTKFLTPAVVISSHLPGKVHNLINKAFGNNCYDQSLSEYTFNYRVWTLEDSIEATESEIDSSKRVLFLVNHDVVIYNFRLEIVERLIADGHEVHISSPYGERIDDLVDLGAIYHEIEMNRHGVNPFEEISILIEYQKLIKEIKPDICLGFTIKPNIYGAIAARQNGVPFVANITGLGTAVENPGLSQKLFILLYKYAFKDIQRVFYQNEENKQFFVKHGIEKGKGLIIPGSGVNLNRFSFKEYPVDDVIKFAFISRIMKEKGIDQYLDAANAIKSQYDNVEFHVCGFCEPEYDGRLQFEHEKGTVIYHGMIRNVADFMSEMHCVIHPSYYPEGLSNVLLEACAIGRPIITTDRSGCREVVEDGINGFMVPCNNSDELIEAIKKFLSLNNEEKKAMGKAARHKVEREFDREIVVNCYVNEVDSIKG